MFALMQLVVSYIQTLNTIVPALSTFDKIFL